MIAAANSIIIKACLTCIPFSVNKIAIAHAIGFEAGLLSFEAGLLARLGSKAARILSTSEKATSLMPEKKV